MAKKKVVLLSSIIIVVSILVVVMIFMNLNLRTNSNNFPDFKRSVHINAKYAQLLVDVQLNPDKTCIYTLSSDPIPYKGQWEMVQKKSDTMKIMLDVSYTKGSQKYRINRLVTMYGTKKSKRMAAIPVQFMKDQYMTVYGEWNQ